MKRRFALVVLGVVLVLGVLTGLQRSLIYFPGQAVPSFPAGVEEVTVTTSDDLVLRGWLLRRDRDQPLMIVFHGNAGTRAGRLPLADALQRQGIAVLLTDYRGYGGNPGRPTEQGLALDALAWQAWAEADHDGPLAYFGESIGAAVATRLAIDEPPAALVLRSPFTSLADVGRVHYPLLPLRWLLFDRYDVVERIGRVDAPVLVVAGGADDIVPPAQSRAVFEAATQPRRWVEVPGAGHNDLAMLAGEELVMAVADLLAP